MFRTPFLTRSRILLALLVAIAADGFQIMLGPFGWMLFDQVIDVIAMISTSLLLGFHPLLLPTFVVEFVPGIDMLPTWTACAAMVVALRRRQQRREASPPPTARPPQVIDV